MRQFTALIPLAAILAIVALGPFAMEHSLPHSSGCFLSVVTNNISCLSSSTVAEHVDTLRQLLTALPAASFALLLALSVLLAIAVFPDSRSRLRPHLAAAVPPSSSLLHSATLARAPVVRWHTRLIHSPTFA